MPELLFGRSGVRTPLFLAGRRDESTGAQPGEVCAESEIVAKFADHCFPRAAGQSGINVADRTPLSLFKLHGAVHDVSEQQRSFRSV